jgi:hypothetical protein
MVEGAFLAHHRVDEGAIDVARQGHARRYADKGGGKRGYLQPALLGDDGGADAGMRLADPPRQPC